jgi:hypothetical protein
MRTLVDTYDFFKKPISMRKFKEIDAVAKVLLELEYFQRMKREQDFVAVKECCTYMQYEYRAQGRVRTT